MPENPFRERDELAATLMAVLGPLVRVGPEREGGSLVLGITGGSIKVHSGHEVTFSLRCNAGQSVSLATWLRDHR